MNDLLEKILSGAIGLTLLLLGWIWIRSTNRADDLEKRMLVIEKNHMSRDEVLRLFSESAQSRKEMHVENQGWQDEIRKKIDDNEAKRSHTEHAILDIVNELKLKNAATEAVEKYKHTRGRNEGGV